MVAILTQEEPRAPRRGPIRRGGNPPVDLTIVVPLLDVNDLLIRAPGGEVVLRERIIASPGEWERLDEAKAPGWILSNYGPLIIAERYTF